MAARNMDMETITASLERSLQNFSLNNNDDNQIRRRQEEEQGSSISDIVVAGIGSSDQIPDTSLELNSHLSLPYHWEQCLDLKTGEIYYINWRNGMKAKEDPRRRKAQYSGDYYSEEDDSSSYDDSEESSSESCNSSSKEHYQAQVVEKHNNNNNVLVVAGCKSCLMYFMVPKQVQDCPKCTGQLLHFDRSEN